MIRNTGKKKKAVDLGECTLTIKEVFIAPFFFFT